MAQFFMKKYPEAYILFRNQVIRKIFGHRAKFPGILRGTECFAIALSDIFQYAILQKNNTDDFNEIDIQVFSLTVLWIACKAHGYSNLKVKSFMTERKTDKTEKQNREDFLEMESFLLNTIDFNIPVMTAYDLLNLEIPSNQFQCGNQETLVVCLKIFMNALQMNPLLSLKPKLGKQFYHITKNGSGSEKALLLYKKSKKRLFLEKKNSIK